MCMFQFVGRRQRGRWWLWWLSLKLCHILLALLWANIVRYENENPVWMWICVMREAAHARSLVHAYRYRKKWLFVGRTKKIHINCRHCTTISYRVIAEVVFHKPVPNLSSAFHFFFSTILYSLSVSVLLWVFIFAQFVCNERKQKKTSSTLCLCTQTKCINFICASTKCINAPHTKRHGELVPTQLQWKIERHKMICTVVQCV